MSASRLWLQLHNAPETVNAVDAVAVPAVNAVAVPAVDVAAAPTRLRPSPISVNRDMMHASWTHLTRLGHSPARTATARLGLDDVTFTSVVRAILFYDELCTDLNAYIHCEDVYPYLTADGKHYALTFGRARTTNGLLGHRVKDSDHDKRILLERHKTLFNQLLTFYKECDLQITDAPGLAKWRWVKLKERAEKWQKQADRHDWVIQLEIKPKIWKEPWWYGRPRGE
jgi:hypothetical protein